MLYDKMKKREGLIAVFFGFFPLRSPAGDNELMQGKSNGMRQPDPQAADIDLNNVLGQKIQETQRLSIEADLGQRKRLVRASGTKNSTINSGWPSRM